MIVAILLALGICLPAQAADPPQGPPAGFVEQAEGAPAPEKGATPELVSLHYVFSQTTGTYTEIVGGTVHGTTSNDDTNFNAIEIGFPFVYNKTSYTQVSIQSNGFVALGATVASSYTPLSTGTTNNVIVALGRDLQGNGTTSELMSLMEGTEPDRVFTIQWKHYKRYGSSYVGDDFNFQIKLHENSDLVEIVYGPFTAVYNSAPPTIQVGLRGGSNADFNNRTTTTDWLSSTAGVANTDFMPLTDTNYPPNGLTFSWTPLAYIALEPNYTASACRGSYLEYPLTAYNFSGMEDTLDLAASGFTWPTSVDPDSLILANKGSGAVTVSVHIPWAAAAGAQDTATVTATGQVSGLSGSATLATITSPVGGYSDYALSPVDRGARASIVYWDGKLYKIGGYGGSGAAQAWLDIYDIAANTWTTGADMPGARYWIDCAPIDLTGTDPKIYCAGGYTTAGTNTLYIYDINTNSWTTGANLPTNRYNYAGVAHNNLYYVIGGYTTATTATMDVYDPVANTWDSTKAPMGATRRYFHAEEIGGKIYVAGGYNTTYLASAEAYDIAANTWAPIASMPSAWLNGADGVKDNRYLFLVGGASNSTAAASNGVLMYDSQMDTWGWQPLFNHMVYSAEADGDGDSLWVVGGRLYENAVFSYSRYTTLIDDCAECTPVAGADFTVNPLGPRPGLPATFTASITGGSPFVTYSWDFGDATTGSGQTVEHTYASPGTYTVVLTATNCDGVNTSVATHDVVVASGPLAAIEPLFLDAVQCPDCQTMQTINVCNEGDEDLTWTISEISSGLKPPSGIESLSGSFVVFDPSAGGDTQFVPGTTQTFCFRAESFTNDYEYVYDAWLKFPADWSVTNVSVVGTPVCDAGTWGTFSWYFEAGSNEIDIFHPRYQQSNDYCVATYCVDVISGAGGSDADVSWYWDGDGYGNAPHNPCSSDIYTPASMASEPCDQAVNPQATVPLFVEDSPIPWLLESPESGTVEAGACDVIDVTFDSTGLAADVYTGTLLIETNDILNEEVEVPVSLTVDGPPENVGFTFTPLSPSVGETVTFSGYADSLTPVEYTWDFGDGTTGVGQNPTHAYDDYGDFIITMTATGCGEPIVVTMPITVKSCFTFVDEQFETPFPPVGWTVTDNIGGSCTWTRNDAFATARPNYAGGIGFAADADSDKCGSGSTMDTELRTFTIDLTGVHTATLQYMTSYNDIATGGDFADVDVSIDGGVTWDNLLQWDADHSPNGPGELVNLDLTPYAGQPQVMVRYHYYLATYDWWWEVDQVNISGCYVPGAASDIEVSPPALTQTLMANLTADQVINIANVGLEPLDWTVDVGCGTPVPWLTADPLAGIVPILGDIDVTVTFDSTGLALGEYNAPVCINSNDPDEPSVQVDATLIVIGTPDIAVEPPSLSATQLPDQVTTQTLEVCDVGDGDLTWALFEVPDGTLKGQATVAPTAQPKAQPEISRLPDGSVDCKAYENSTLFEPAEVAAACSSGVIPKIPTDSPFAPTDLGFALDIGYISDNFVSFTLNDFTGQTVIGTNATPFYGMDFDPTGEVLFALNDTSDELGTIDLTTGAFTGLVPCPPGGGAANWTGLSIDPRNGDFYGSTATDLFLIDPTTGATTLIGPFGTSGALMIDIAINMDGQMYGHDIGDDSIYTIDMVTGAATSVGLTGYAANYAQGMDFDNEDGTLYIFLYIGSGANVYGTVNLATGAVTPLATSAPQGEFEGATQTLGMLPDIPWLSASPITGTLSAGGCTDITVSFDSTGLPFGEYTGNLLVESNDPDEPEVMVPVTLLVQGTVDFVYHDLEDVVHEGESVFLAGDFNGWAADALEMTPNGDYSVFTASIILSPGVHEYKYVVNDGAAHWDWLQSYPDGGNRTMDTAVADTVDDYRDIVPGYYVLQWPYETTTTVTIPTENIYGQIWAWGLTPEPDAPRALLAELGYGVAADPAAWATWEPMDWGSQQGNNDEYQGIITPDTVGVFSYAVRFNGNWGEGNPNNQWYYGDKNGGEYDPADAGVLTVLGPTIELTKTVGVGPDCATTDSIIVLAGTEVTYCYTVTNTGDLTLTVHDLVDDKLGDLLVGEALDLAPGESYFITETATINADVTNTATWTASDGTYTAEATDSATVNVVAPSITLDKTVGVGPDCATTSTLEVPAGTEVTYCYTVTNTGDLTLTVHDLVDDKLGDLLVGEALELAPGESYFITETATINADVTNTATWTASDGDFSVEATDSATVTVTGVQPTFKKIYLPAVFN